MAAFDGLGAIAQIALRVHDVDAAVEFYRDRLGLPHLFTVPGMAFFDCDGIRLMVGLPEGDTYDHPGSILYFRTGDIEAAHAALEERGVPFVQPPRLVADMGDHELWLGFFRDPWDNVLALMEERAR